MNKQQIFEGLSLSIEEAVELVHYWNVADDDVGIIDHLGNMTTSDDVWKRPCAERNYKVLRTALEGCPVEWIELGDNTITVDFSKLRYNTNWVKKMFINRGLGVCDSIHGLKLYQKKNTFDKEWFEDQIWTLRGVTVESLGLKKKETVSLTPHTENPDYAEWMTLYFAA